MSAVLFLLLLPAIRSVASEVRCITSGSNGLEVPLDPSRIDDGYCDCIHTFEDEPRTSACAGSKGWPSVLLYEGDGLG